MQTAYTLLLNAFPKGFRSAFADEMRQVFNDALADAAESDAAGQGRQALLRFFAHEMLDAVWLLIYEYWLLLNKEGMMSASPMQYEDDLIAKRSTWPETFLGIAPILAWAGIQVLGYLTEMNSTPLMAGLFFGAVGLALLGGLALFVLGVRRGFPAWSMPYLAFILLLLLILPAFRISAAMMMPGWVSLALAALIVALLLISRSLDNFVLLWRKIRRDGTLISFGLYNMLLFWLLVIADETDEAFMLPFHLIAYALLAVGSVVYLRSGSVGLRFAGLVFGALTAQVLLSVAIETYWSSVSMASGISIGLIGSLVVTVILAMPAVLVWAVRKARSAF
jgi:hypothetical protein